MKTSPLKTITVSADTYHRLVNFPLSGGAISGRANADGTVTFPIPASLHAALNAVNENPELALLTLLGAPIH